MGKLLLLATSLAVGSPCAAQTISDGDTLKQGGVIYRIWGIDAPELAPELP
jgi:endonuclease YncB( thermonuclease family)